MVDAVLLVVVVVVVVVHFILFFRDHLFSDFNSDYDLNSVMKGHRVNFIQMFLFTNRSEDRKQKE